MLVRCILLVAALALVVIGIASIYALGNPAESGTADQNKDLPDFWKKQAVFTVVALVGFVAANLISYRRLGTASYWIYTAFLILLGLLLLDKLTNIAIGSFISIPLINGTRRWIRIAVAGSEIAVQPSEFCKVAYILALAWYLRYRSNYRKFKGLIGPFALTLLPMVLILLEPDLGTVLLMMPILFTMLFVAGAKVKHLLIIILLAIAVSPLLWLQMSRNQKMRVSSVLLQSETIRNEVVKSPTLARILVGRQNFSENRWRRDEGFHLIRSKYAIASGGFKGYGFRQGPFVKYDFLPERQNDFIFAVIAHQWGFWGAMVVLALYVVIIACGLEIAGNNTDPFGKLVAVGIVVMFAVQVLVNVSMTLGLMPITGLTLPFVSYGGSSLLVSMISVGLLNNIGRHRPFSVSPKVFQQ